MKFIFQKKGEKIYKSINIFSLLVLIFNMSLSGVFFVALPVVQADTTLPYIEVEKQAISEICEQAEITLTITGDGDPIEERKPIDVVFVIDRSSSMEGSYLTDVKTAVKGFIDEMDFDSSIPDRVGVVSYSGYTSNPATIDYPFGSNGEDAKDAVENIEAAGGTCIECGLRVAYSMLNGSNEQYVILLSDGVANLKYPGTNDITYVCNYGTDEMNCPTSASQCINSAVTWGTNIKNDHSAKIYSIGYRLEDISGPAPLCDNGGTTEDLAEQTLKDISSDPADYYYSGDPSNINTVFDDIAKDINDIAGYDAKIVEILPTELTYNGMASGYPEPDSTQSVASGTELIWEFGNISIGQSKEVSFYVISGTSGYVGLADVYPDTRVEYKDYEDTLHETPFPETQINIVSCNPEFGSLTICKFNDVNQNQIKDLATDTPLMWPFEVTLPDASVIATTTDAETGCVTISGLPLGDYTVTEADDNDDTDGVSWVKSAPLDGINTLTLYAGYTNTTFLNYEDVCDNKITTTISKVECSSEEYLPNWGASSTIQDEPTVIDQNTAENYISDINTANKSEVCWLADGWEFEWSDLPNPGNNVVNGGAGWNTVGPTASGTVSFVRDSDSDLKVREVVKAGYVPFSGDSDESAEIYCYNYIETYDNYAHLDIVDYGQPEFTRNYYCVAFNAVLPNDPELGTISGYKYEDQDGATTTDEYLQHPGLGWIISLFDGNATTTYTTGSDGYFVFNNLVDGVYKLTETIKSGWTQLMAPLSEITISGGNDSTGNNFVNYEENDNPDLTTIKGCKYNDARNDGSISGDSKLSGWEVELLTCPYLCDDSPQFKAAVSAGECTVQQTVKTDSNGCYEFEVDGDSCYRVQEKMSQIQIDAGWKQTYPIDPAHYFFYVAQGEKATNIDFANYLLQCGDGYCDSNNGENGDNCCEDCGTCGGGNTLFPTNRGGGSFSTPQEEQVVVKGEEGEPNLFITKEVAPTQVNQGDTGVEYVINVSNNGTITAFAVTLTDVLPSGLSYSDYAEQARTWSLGDIAPGETKSTSFTANVDKDASIGNLTNVASAVAENHEEVSADATIEVLAVKVLAESGFRLIEFIITAFSAVSLFVVGRKLNADFA
jgi:uncharacterized repeat protein (TIGR01451 family)